MEKEYITIEAKREGYSVDQVGYTLTVGDLINYLNQWDEDTPIYISNDNGYTFGAITTSRIDSDYLEEDEEENE